jgi:cyclophilin family peptidyl-prolyl cis-trans isomerase
VPAASRPGGDARLSTSKGIDCRTINTCQNTYRSIHAHSTADACPDHLHVPARRPAGSFNSAASGKAKACCPQTCEFGLRCYRGTYRHHPHHGWRTPKVAPIGVENFIGLASGTKDWTSPVSHAKKHGVPLYDGTIFHRVIPSFMIQGGDPKGDGTGDPGYKFKNETSPSETFDRPGRLAYANAGPDTNGSQFFITEVPYPSLNGKYTILGQCDDAAVELVKKIARMATDGERPLRPIKITHIEIHRAGASSRPAVPKPSPAVKKPT